jgi:hypothetical protein
MPPNIGRKIFLYALTLLIILFSVSRYLVDFSINIQTQEESFRRNLLYVILVSIVISWVYFIILNKTFPVSSTNRSPSQTILVGLVILISSFAVTWQSCITLNLLIPASKSYNLSGTITSKNVEITPKGARFYYLDILPVNEMSKKFQVSKRIYEEYRIGDVYSNKIYQGFSGIEYSQ